jgi:hypothetical protein
MTIQSIITRVQTYYPGAVVSMSVSGKYFIEHDDQNLNDVFLFEDCDTIDDAWMLIWETMRIQRNMNRTHPLKKMISEQKKLQNRERIANRIHG